MPGYPEGALGEPGTWTHKLRDGHDSAYLTCPDCGTTRTLDDHTINRAGVVTPAVICSGCPFREYVYLIDWRPTI